MAQEVIEVTQREVEIIEVIERGPVGQTGPQPDINYTVVSSARTLESADLIAADTSGGAFTLTLPLNPSNGDAVDIFDFSETFDTNPLTIARNGSRIESLEENLVCNVEGAYFTLIYTGATRGWQVLPRYGTSGGAGESTLTTQGDMLYRGAAVNTRLPIGTAGQILKVNSGATAPEWGAAPATGVTSVSGTAPIASSGGATPTISISAATTSAAGSMSSADKTKLDAITGTNTGDQTITLTGNVTGSGTGSFAATIANDAVDNTKLSNMAQSTLKGRATLSTGDPEDLSASQVRTILNVADGAEVNVQANWTEASSGSDAFIQNKPTLGGAAALNVGTTAGTVAAGDDARLSDTRTPTAHAASHAAGGNDALPYPTILSSPTGVNKFKLGLGGDSETGRFVGVTTAGDPLIGVLSYDGKVYDPADEVGSSAFGMVLGANDTNLFAQYLQDGGLEAQYTFPATGGTLALAGDAPASHTHGNLTNDGKVGSTSGLPVVTTTAGAVTTLALGTANQVLRVNSGATGVEFGAGFDAASPPAIGNTTPAAITATTLAANNGTLTASAPVLDLAQTWNNAAVTFVGLRFNATDTASSSNSSIAEFQLNGASYFRIQKEKNTGLQCCLDVGATTNASMDFQCGGNRIFRAYGAGAGAQPLYLETNGGLTFTPISPSSASFNLQAEAANTLAARQGTAAQSFRLYSTFTSTTSFERLNLIAQTGGSFIIGTEKGSAGGTARGLELRTDGTARLTIGSAGTVTLNTTLAADAQNISTDTTTGTKIGTGTTQKIGFFNATPVVQQAAVADATDAASTQARLNDLLARLRTLGLIAT